MYRRQSYEDLPVGILPQDWYMHLYHAKFGKIGFINRPMAVYRRHAGGVWWEAAGHIEVVWKKYGLEHLALYTALLKLYGADKTDRNIILTHVSSLFEALAIIDEPYKQQLLVSLSESVPDAFEFYLSRQEDKLSAQVQATHETEQREAVLLRQLQETEKQLRQAGQALQEKSRYIDELTSSKSWKITKPLRSANMIPKKIYAIAKPKKPERRH